MVNHEALQLLLLCLHRGQLLLQVLQLGRGLSELLLDWLPVWASEAAGLTSWVSVARGLSRALPVGVCHPSGLRRYLRLAALGSGRLGARGGLLGAQG